MTTMYIVSFNPEPSKGFLYYFDKAVEYVFVLDLFLNFIQAYVNPETLIEHTGLKEIARNYVFNGWFFVDFISVFPFDAMLPTG